jgi:putative transposase
MDEANRKALGIDIGTSMPSERVTRYLNQLVEIHGKPQALRCDNGPEFISLICPRFNGQFKQRF